MNCPGDNLFKPSNTGILITANPTSVARTVDDSLLSMQPDNRLSMHPVNPKTGRLTIQLNEVWPSVGCKTDKQWAWLAMEADSREIVGGCGGDRFRLSAQQLWQSLPAICRQCVVGYTDFWEADEQNSRSWRSQVAF